MLRSLACMLVSLFVSSLAMAEDTPTKVVNPLPGKWKITKAEADGGKKAPFPPNAHFRFDENGKTVELIVGDEKPRPGTYKCDDTKTPHQIMLNPGLDQPGHGVYKVEKDVLTICISVKQDVAPPKDFAGGDAQGVLLFVCERVK
jgi:uncharacterized protein (TIGR03067 family)